MNCRDFILEFEERLDLSQAAQTHLNHCPGCRKTIVLQTQVWEAIDGLPQIDAPKNFNFTVKAKIANARPADFRPKFLPVLRYVLPLSAIVLVLGLVVFNTNIFFGDAAPQVATVVSPSTPVAAENPPNSFPSPEPPIVGNSVAQSFTDESFAAATVNQSAKPSNSRQEARLVTYNSARKSPSAPRRAIVKDNSGNAGSRDSTWKETRVLMPQGIPNMAARNPSNVGNSPLAASQDIWSFVGIEIVSKNNAQTIKSVKPNSLAARSGARVGDVIEAVNGVNLSAEPLNKPRVEIKSLTVTRGTEKIEITF